MHIVVYFNKKEVSWDILSLPCLQDTGIEKITCLFQMPTLWNLIAEHALDVLICPNETFQEISFRYGYPPVPCIAIGGEQVTYPHFHIPVPITDEALSAAIGNILLFPRFISGHGGKPQDQWQNNMRAIGENFWRWILSEEASSHTSAELSTRAANLGIPFDENALYSLVLIYVYPWNNKSEASLPLVRVEDALRTIATHLFCQNDQIAPVMTLSNGYYGLVRHGDDQYDPIGREMSRAPGQFVAACERYLSLDVLCLSDISVRANELCSRYSRLRQDVHNYTESRRDGYDRSAPVDHERTILSIKNYIEHNLGHDISKKGIAAHVHLNPDYMAKLFKHNTGQILGDYIIERKVNHAKLMLTETGTPVGEIASRLGFSNFSHFSNVFTKRAGVSPSRYRRDNSRP